MIIKYRNLKLFRDSGVTCTADNCGVL